MLFRECVSIPRQSLVLEVRRVAPREPEGPACAGSLRKKAVFFFKYRLDLFNDHELKTVELCGAAKQGAA